MVFENEAKQLFAECGPREIYPKVLENFVIFGIFTLFVFFKQYEGQNKKKDVQVRVIIFLDMEKPFGSVSKVWSA